MPFNINLLLNYNINIICVYNVGSEENGTQRMKDDHGLINE